MNYIGFKPEKVEDTVAQLNQLLCNYQIYYQNLRNYHWNIAGQHFFDLHEKFEELYNEAKVNIDAIAERILTLRMKPASTLKMYLEHAEVRERSTNDPKEMVSNILEDHKKIINNLRQVIATAGKASDEGSIDLTAGFLASIEKNSWMLDAWLNK